MADEAPITVENGSVERSAPEPNPGVSLSPGADRGSDRGRSNNRFRGREFTRRPSNGGGPEISNLPIHPVAGYIDMSSDGHAVVRTGFSQSRRDAYLSIALVRRLRLRPGDFVDGTAREPRENDRYWGMVDISKVNGKDPEKLRDRRRFENLVPV